MTYKELLERVAIVFPWHIRQALRAVVELHKPKAHLSDNDLWCEGCYPTMATYPCPTIQAIEKELTNGAE